MAFLSLKLVSPLPPLAGKTELHTKRPKEIVVHRAVPVQQVNCEMFQEQQSPPPATLTTSRRDALLSLTTASLAATTFFSTEPAEARIVNPEIRRKIMEKLEMLREKAGLSKPKSEDGRSVDKIKTPAPPPPTPPPKGETPAPKEETPPPYPNESLGRSLVDAIIP